jgi:glycosyltransferase involved in cell wall biosynthesis
MRLSVVVPVQGRRPLLEQTLKSLARQEGAPSHEVVVVDDEPDPELSGWIRGLGLPLDVVVVHHPRNRGRSAARNSGIARARGEVIVFLDADMRVSPDFLAAHDAAHVEENSVALGTIVTALELPRTAHVAYTDTRGVHKVRPGRPIPARYFMTGNSSVAAPLLARAGGFDEEFSEYGGEDTEMGYRLASLGGCFRHAPRARAEHLDQHDARSTAKRLRRYGETMLPILARKVPAAREELKLHLAEPLRWPDDGFGLAARKLALRVLARRMFWGAAAVLGDSLPEGVRWHGLFDFMRASAYLDGYRQAAARRR